MAERRLRMVVQVSSAGAEQKFNRLGKSMSGVNKLAGALGVTFGVIGLIALAKNVVRTAAAFEGLKVQLETVEGSAKAAERVFAGLQEFASKTPFQVDALTRSWVQFRAIGLAPTESDLRAVGDLASAFGRSIEDATTAVTRAAFGETEALKSFGIAAKVEGDKLRIIFRGVEQSVNRDAKSITDALIGLSEANFTGSMERQSKTLDGVLSTMSDNVKILAASFGDTLLPALKTIAMWVSDAAKNWGLFGIAANNALADVIEGVAAYARAIDDAAISAQTFFTKLLAGRGAYTVQDRAGNQAIDTLDLLAEGLREKARVAMDVFTTATNSASEALGGSGGGGGGGPNLKSQLAAVQDQIEKLEKALDKTEESLRAAAKAAREAFQMELEREAGVDAAIGSFLERIETAAVEAAHEAGQAYVTGFLDAAGEGGGGDGPPGMFRDFFKGAEEPMKTFADSLENIVADALLDAFLGDGIDWQMVGAQIGEAIGFAMAGPIGGAIGAILGSALGSLAGGDPNKSQGSFTFGGGDRFRGQGGVSGFQEQFSQALDAIEAIVQRVEEVVSGSLELTQQMEVIVNKQGDAILLIKDQVTGATLFEQAFSSQQEAMDAGLEQLFSTAILNAEGPLSLAFQEILANAVNAGLEITLESLDKLAEMSTFLQGLDPTFDSVLDQIANFRIELDSMGLSAEATADVLAGLATAEENRRQSLESGAMNELFRIWERSGLMQAELSQERARLEQVQTQITLARVRLEAEFFGFMTEVLMQALDALDKWAEDSSNFQIQGSGFRVGRVNFGGGGSRGGRRGPSRADKQASLLEEWERFINSGAKAQSFNKDLRDLRESFFGPGGFMARFKELGLSTQEMASQFARMARDIRAQANAGLVDVLRDLRLGSGGFGGASLSQQFFAQGSEFNRLAALSVNDLDSRGQLADVARSYIESIQQMFGNSRRGRALIEEVRGRIEGIVGKEGLLSPSGQRDTKRNSLLDEIRVLLGGKEREEKKQDEMLTLARNRTNWARLSWQQAQDRERKLAEIASALRKGTERIDVKPFILNESAKDTGTYGRR